MSDKPTSTEELLIRLDERIAAIKRDIENINREIERIRNVIDENKEEERTNLKNYVSKDEFQPIQRAFYAMAALIGTTVIGTLLSMVIQKPM